MLTPPSTASIWPVIHLERSESKKSTAPAMSSGSPRRPRGITARSWVSGPSFRDWPKRQSRACTLGDGGVRISQSVWSWDLA